jgi:hypothetical protein
MRTKVTLLQVVVSLQALVNICNRNEMEYGFQRKLKKIRDVLKKEDDLAREEVPKMEMGEDGKKITLTELNKKFNDFLTNNSVEIDIDPIKEDELEKHEIRIKGHEIDILKEVGIIS